MNEFIETLPHSPHAVDLRWIVVGLEAMAKGEPSDIRGHGLGMDGGVLGVGHD
ncbi:MAG: hypothetical protein OXD43_06635 [Bacteroidetes bacterium]|nr:hypothetical protein [Bacteroidota bacterium]